MMLLTTPFILLFSIWLCLGAPPTELLTAHRACCFSYSLYRASVSCHLDFVLTHLNYGRHCVAPHREDTEEASHLLASAHGVLVGTKQTSLLERSLTAAVTPKLQWVHTISVRERCDRCGHARCWYAIGVGAPRHITRHVC